MSEKVYMDKDIWVGILDAIRPKIFSNNQYVAGEVAGLINMLESPAIPPNLPNDGKIRIGYSMPATAPNKTARLCYYGNTSGTAVVVDWGDGSALETYKGGGRKRLAHIYTDGAGCIITMEVKSGSIKFGGGSASSLWESYAYEQNRIRWVVFGNAGIDSYALYYGTAIRAVRLPAGMETINTYALSNCIALEELDIPATVTSIEANALNGARNLLRLRFNSETPPTVASSTAFNSLPADCVISVPTGKMSAYTSAENYPSSDNYTYVEE